MNEVPLYQGARPYHLLSHTPTTQGSLPALAAEAQEYLADKKAPPRVTLQ